MYSPFTNIVLFLSNAKQIFLVVLFGGRTLSLLIMLLNFLLVFLGLFGVLF